MFSIFKLFFLSFNIKSFIQTPKDPYTYIPIIEHRFLKKFFSKVRQKIEEKFDRLAKRNSQNNYTRDRSFLLFKKMESRSEGRNNF